MNLAAKMIITETCLQVSRRCNIVIERAVDVLSTSLRRSDDLPADLLEG